MLTTSTVRGREGGAGVCMHADGLQVQIRGGVMGGDGDWLEGMGGRFEGGGDGLGGEMR